MEKDPSNSNPGTHSAQTLEFPYIISFFHSKDLVVDEIKLQALEVETVVDSLYYVSCFSHPDDDKSPQCLSGEGS